VSFEVLGIFLTMKKMVSAKRDGRWLRSGTVWYLAAIASFDPYSDLESRAAAMSGPAIVGEQRQLVMVGLGSSPWHGQVAMPTRLMSPPSSSRGR